MYNFFKYSMIVLFAGVILSACNKDDKETAVPIFSMDQAEFVKVSGVQQGGGSIVLNLKTNQDITIASGETWCTVSKGSNTDGILKLTFVLTPNASVDVRESVVTIKCSGFEDITLTVSQLGIAPAIAVAEAADGIALAENLTPGETGGAAQEFVLNISANLAVAFELPSWITEKEGNPAGGVAGAYTFIVEGLTADGSRNGNVVVKAANAAHNVNVTVAVTLIRATDASSLTVAEAADGFEVDAEGAEITLNVTTNILVTFELPSWITAKAGNPAGVGGAYKFIVPALGAGAESRDSVVVVKSANAAFSVPEVKVAVTQIAKAYVMTTISGRGPASFSYDKVWPRDDYKAVRVSEGAFNVGEYLTIGSNGKLYITNRHTGSDNMSILEVDDAADSMRLVINHGLSGNAAGYYPLYNGALEFNGVVYVCLDNTNQFLKCIRNTTTSRYEYASVTMSAEASGVRYGFVQYDGFLYQRGRNGDLLKVNPADGTMTVLIAAITTPQQSYGMAFDPTNSKMLYYSTNTTDGNRIYRVDVTENPPVPEHFAGTGDAAHLDGPRLEAKFNAIRGLDFDKDGNLYIADSGNRVIRLIDKDGKVKTFFGKPGVQGQVDGAKSAATIYNPYGVAVNKTTGAVYVLDRGNTDNQTANPGLLRKITVE